MLLRSRPDTVHGFLLRKTQTSTSLIGGCSATVHPRIGITPAVADCRYRAPLTPRLHGNVIPLDIGLMALSKYTDFPLFCQDAGSLLCVEDVKNLCYIKEKNRV